MQAPGENLLIKMWDSLVDKGIGSLLKPWQLRREAIAIAEAQASNMLIIAQAERTVDVIKLGKNEAASIFKLENNYHEKQDFEITPEALIQLAAKLNYDKTLRTEVNTAKAILVAESILEEETLEPPKENIDQDWLYRWRDYAGAVSSAELQSMWGSILAGEVKTPGSYSLRTLEFVKNLSADEAKKIEHIMQFVINDSFIYKGKTTIDNNSIILNNYGIFFGDLLELQNLGVISGVEGAGSFTITLTPSDIKSSPEIILVSKNQYLSVTHPLKSELSLYCYGLTRIGKELYNLCGVKTNKDYFLAMGLEIKSMGYNVVLGAYETQGAAKIARKGLPI